MGSRRVARQLAVLAFYQADVLDEPLPERLATVLAAEGADAGQAQYAERVVALYTYHHAAVDRALREAGARWDLERMSATDRAVLRVGATELLLMPDVPEAVALDEAIEIARRYGDVESGRFVNGVLDAVRRHKERAAGEEETADGEVEVPGDGEFAMDDDGESPLDDVGGAASAAPADDRAEPREQALELDDTRPPATGSR